MIFECFEKVCVFVFYGNCFNLNSMIVHELSNTWFMFDIDMDSILVRLMKKKELNACS